MEDRRTTEDGGPGDGWRGTVVSDAMKLRKMIVLERLLTVYTLEQVEKITRLSESAQGREEMPDLVIRWKNGKPRWIGLMGWEGM